MSESSKLYQEDKAYWPSSDVALVENSGEVFQAQVIRTYPQVMYPSLSSVPIQTPAVGISWKTIHYCEADRTSRVTLQSEVVMGPCHRMIMLMDNEMPAISVLIAVVDVKPLFVRKPGYTRCRRLCCIEQLRGEEGYWVSNIDATSLNGCGRGRCPTDIIYDFLLASAWRRNARRE